MTDQNIDLAIGVTNEVMQKFSELVAEHGADAYQAAVAGAFMLAINGAGTIVLTLLVALFFTYITIIFYRKARTFESADDAAFEWICTAVSILIAVICGVGGVLELDIVYFIGIFEPEKYLMYLTLESILK